MTGRGRALVAIAFGLALAAIAQVIALGLTRGVP
jgi:hypothetical protein